MKRVFIISCLFCVVLTGYAQSQLVKNLEKGKKQCLVVYGTSIESNVRGQQWVRKMGEELNRIYPGMLTLYNSGKSGENSEWGLENLHDSVLSRYPDTVIIEFATNDAVTRFNITPEICRTNTEKLISSIKKANPKCEVILHTACGFPIGENKKKRPAMDTYNQIYRDLTKQHKLLLIDETEFLKHIGETFGNDSLRHYLLDGVHPTTEGALQLYLPTSLNVLLRGR